MFFYAPHYFSKNESLQFWVRQPGIGDGKVGQAPIGVVGCPGRLKTVKRDISPFRLKNIQIKAAALHIIRDIWVSLTRGGSTDTENDPRAMFFNDLRKLFKISRRF